MQPHRDSGFGVEKPKKNQDFRVYIASRKVNHGCLQRLVALEIR